MWQWEYQQHALAQHFRVLTLDLPGAGLSDKPEIDYRPDQMLDYFVGFMDAVKVPQATLVGNSMGAGLAIGMALTHPDTGRQARPDRRLTATRHEETHQSVVRRALETSAPSWLSHSAACCSAD
jgi:Predicted hydrolases or acyltransferases (alpha/beta hydrolase superfamily)